MQKQEGDAATRLSLADLIAGGRMPPPVSVDAVLVAAGHLFHEAPAADGRGAKLAAISLFLPGFDLPSRRSLRHCRRRTQAMRRLATAGACALASLAAQGAGTPAEIPFKLEGHNIVVQVEVKRGQRLPFAFDSGLSSGNIITAVAARSAGIKADQDMAVHDAAGERQPAQLTTVPNIRVGGATLDHVPFAITDIPAKVLQRPGGGKLAGFVGAPLIKDAVLCLDYTHRRLLRWSVADFDAAGFASVPMKLNHGLPTVEVSIDGRAATLIVDSGADTALTVYAAFAEANDFGHRYKPLGTQNGNGGGGRTFLALITQAQTIDIGPGAEFSGVPLQVIPQGMDPAWGIDGVIGFQMLRQLDPCLDPNGARLLYKSE